MLCLGIVTGAFLAETSLLDFSITSIRTFRPQSSPQANGPIDGFQVPRRPSNRTLYHSRELTQHRFGL